MTQFEDEDYYADNAPADDQAADAPDPRPLLTRTPRTPWPPRTPGTTGTPSTPRPKPKLCGCPEGQQDPRKCKSWGQRNTRVLDGTDWGMILVTVLAAGVVFSVIPSWKVALGIASASFLINLFGPDTTLATVIGPAHLASSVYLVAAGLQKYARMSVNSSRITALLLLTLLSWSTLAMAEYADRDDVDRRD